MPLCASVVEKWRQCTDSLCLTHQLSTGRIWLWFDILLPLVHDIIKTVTHRHNTKVSSTYDERIEEWHALNHCPNFKPSQAKSFCFPYSACYFFYRWTNLLCSEVDLKLFCYNNKIMLITTYLQDNERYENIPQFFVVS